MRTKNDILTEIITIINSTPIGALNGETTQGTRITDSDKEDCVSSIIASTTHRFIQQGALIVKIFYNDINYLNTFFEDSKRGGIMEGYLYDLSEILLKTNGFSFQVQTRELYTEKVQEDDVNQHFAILRIDFKLINN